MTKLEARIQKQREINRLCAEIKSRSWNWQGHIAKWIGYNAKDDRHHFIMGENTGTGQCWVKTITVSMSEALASDGNL